MKRLLLSALIGLLLFSSACAIHPTTSVTVQTTTNARTTTATSSTTATTTQANTTTATALETWPDLSDNTAIIQKAGLGNILISGGVFWSPDSASIVFNGVPGSVNLQDPQAAVYIYNVANRELNQITSLLSVNESYWQLKTPTWSDDSRRVTISHYLSGDDEYQPKVGVYDTQSQQFEELPINSRFASLSPDGTRLVYSDQDNQIKIYDLANKSTTAPLPGIKGFSPMLSADNQHLLFCLISKPASKAGADELDQICLIDIADPQQKQILVPDAQYLSVKWLATDQTALVEYNTADGWRSTVIDITSGKQIDRSGSAIALTVNGSLRYVVSSMYNSYELDLYDATLNKLGVFSMYPGSSPILSILGLTTDSTLLRMEADWKYAPNVLVIAEINALRKKQVAVINPVRADDVPGYVFSWPLVWPSPDGMHVAWIDDYTRSLYMLDMTALQNWLKNC